MNPLSGIILTALVVGVFTMPRRWAAVCAMSGALLLTQSQSLELVGFTLFPTRILAYAAFVRVVIRREFSRSLLTQVDWALIWLYLFTLAVLLTRPEESAPLRIAKTLDILLGYLAFRSLIVEPGDLRWLLGILAVGLIPYVSVLAVESFTQRNLFEVLGASTSKWLREGRVRCFGSFRHPSLLGSLGATFFPLFIALAFDREQRKRAILGALLCTAVVGFSNSGGPLSTWVTGVAGWCLWPLRHRMRAFRWSLVCGMAVLAVVMKAPIWYLLTRVSSVTGGSGWHRSYLIDVAVQHLDKWWFAGMPVAETRDWFPYVIDSTGGADITNQFIWFGLSAGLLGIALFVLFLYRSYSYLGVALRSIRDQKSAGVLDERLMWGLGVMLAVHISNWLGITYFDQFSIIWLLQAAALCSVSRYWSLKAAEGADEEASDAQFAEPAHSRYAI
ncbi:MAG TPA: hypothetical protein PLK78_16995 [Verrucomicrobiota bacterium]|nr:hypothetical protein [Verrucomicrobiota bacterium]